jgi:1-acyl-sn-glycerol-3-phosphate acyltransferase
MEEAMGGTADADTGRPVESIGVGGAVPRRDYGLLGAVGRWTLRRMRWRVEGEFPDHPRLVVAIAPHSSTWDFVIGAALVFVLGLRVAFIAKHTLFRSLLGAFLRWLGGIPVDRARPEGLAEALSTEFHRHGQLWLAITPEGTRREGARFKSGFYRIALAAGVPILPVYFNYRRRIIGFLPVIHPGADVAEGVDRIRRLLEQRGARRP